MDWFNYDGIEGKEIMTSGFGRWRKAIRMGTSRVCSFVIYRVIFKVVLTSSMVIADVVEQADCRWKLSSF